MVNKNVLLLFGILVVGLVVAQQQGLLNIPLEIASTCKNIFSNVYHFLGCSENPGQTQAFSSSVESDVLGIKEYGAIQCPSTAGRCTISSSVKMAVYNSCNRQSYWYGGNFWSCSGMIGTGIDAKVSQWVFTFDNKPPTSLFTINAYQMHLYDCGSSQCASSTSGTPLLNTLGCKIVTDKSIYDANGNLIKAGQAGVNFEYVVPFYGNILYTTDALRQVTGQACNECTTDADCAIGRQFQYKYLDGKTYGADATTASQLNLYACKPSTQTCVDGTNFPGAVSDTCQTSTNLNKCIAFATVPVQCIPGSATCGSNAVCDPATFTCKQSQQVECSSDFDCGNAGIVCDFSTKTLKRNGCFSNKCGSQVIQSVEACTASQCPSGYFLDTDYKCKQGVPQQTICPYECCQGDSRYFDKACAIGSCVNNICIDKPQPPVSSSMLNIIVAAIAGLLVFLLTGREALKSRDEIDIAISAVIASIIALGVWWIMENILAILAGSAILTVLGGLALYFFGGAFITIALIIGLVIKGLKGE